MIKRILLALTPGSTAASSIRCATALARCHDAEIAALAIVESPGVLALEVAHGAAGGGLPSTVSDAYRDAMFDTVQQFRDIVTEAGIKHRTSVEEGIPADRILDELRFFDLLILGRDLHFSFNRLEAPGETLARIVKRAVAPVFVVGPEFHGVNKVMFAFDGSVPASRTMQRFAQFEPFRQAADAYLVHVRHPRDEEEREAHELMLRRAGGFLRAHGFGHVEDVSLVGEDPAEILLAQAHGLGADVIVAGAHSVSALRRIAFGSTTLALLERGTHSLFLYH